MNKRFKCILVLLAVLLIGFRIWYVNHDVKETETVYYQMGEKVSLDMDGETDQQMQAYTIEALGAELITKEEMAERCHVEPDNLYADFAKYYYLVRVRCSNEGEVSDNEHGVALINIGLIGTSYYSLHDDIGFALLNPNMPGSSFALKPGTSAEMTLVYQFIPEVQGKKDNLLTDEPRLVISSYPVRREIQLHIF